MRKEDAPTEKTPPLPKSSNNENLRVISHFSSVALNSATFTSQNSSVCPINFGIITFFLKFPPKIFCRNEFLF